MLSKLSWKKETDGSLDFTGGKGGLLVVTSKLGGFKSNALEDIVDEGVKDGDTSLRDTGLRVNLLEDLVDVGRVGLSALLVALLAGCLLGRLCGLL